MTARQQHVASEAAGRRFLDELTAMSSGLDLGAITRAVDLLLACYARKGKVITLGNGGSAATAAHFAADLGKYATGGALGFRAMDLASNAAAQTAWTNDTSWDETYVGLIRPWLEPDDVVVAFSVNGGRGFSGNVAQGLRLARRTGASTVGIAGNGGGEFPALCDVAITIPTPELTLVTPLTEAMHVVIHHLICVELRRALS